jgi:Fic family protein
MKDLLQEIESLKTELGKLSPLKLEDEQRLWRKFRLEWNYNSNHIEGNTLTYGETYLLLIKGDVTGDHKAQEIDEMRAHDVVLSKVIEYANDQTRFLTEADIREWNKIILVRPFWKEAITVSGQPTQKLVEPGNYKTSPNSVRLTNGEIFSYSSPEETPVLMKELLDWLREEEQSKTLHPVELASMLHYKFVRIHPFDDCNGRTSRLLMNYVLLRNSLPPVIVKSNDKSNYLLSLSKADAGNLNAFIRYIAEQLVWSLEVSIKAAKGENIEELDDIDKEIEIIVRSSKVNKSEVYSKTFDRIFDVIDISVERLVNLYFTKLIKLSSLVLEYKIYCSLNELNILGDIVSIGEVRLINEPDPGTIIKQMKDTLTKNQERIDNKYTNEIQFDISLSGLKSNLESDFNYVTSFRILFQEYYYDISTDGRERNFRRLYSERLTDLEITTLVNQMLKGAVLAFNNKKIDK